ncbi:hypothetical protein IWW38_001712 [Coemansia aciculifera]|uniref:Uncharacterized protein n=1 Tax=Coemansia aciculifera TaxID=417176 RepID=A0ACC1M7F4_9FUNG|nr:hypothetical protein IWW38_001712 [Coemansia aciculifera]
MQLARVAAASLCASTATVLYKTRTVNLDDKKTIYDSPNPATDDTNADSQISQQKTRIKALLGSTRRTTISFLTSVQVHGQALVSQWIGLERQVADLVRQTVPAGERLAPGIIYVGVAALAGPIFTRRRNFAVRWASPLVFGAAAAAYFLPGTASVVLRNVWGRYGDPKTIDYACEQWQSVRKAEQALKERVAANIQELRMSLQEGRGFSQQQEPSKKK